MVMEMAPMAPVRPEYLSVTTDELIEAAMIDDWHVVDDMLSEYCQTPESLGLARENLASPDDNLRRLSANIFQLSPFLLTNEDIEALEGQLNDRLLFGHVAIALAQKGILTLEVEDALMRATEEDDGTAFMASICLEQFGHEDY